MRTCRICREKFEPVRSIQPTCGKFDCNYEFATRAAQKSAEKRAKVVRKETKAKLDKLKTRSDYIKEAQVAFNAYIRARDSGKPCICCGRSLGEAKVGGGFDAGHYRSIGSAPHLRFDERNCHGQSKQCNRYGAGRAVDYRIGLIARLGLDVVEELESDNTTRKYTIDQLKAIRDEYRMKLKQLKGSK